MEDLDRLHELILTGDEPNIQLAQQLAQGLGMKKIALYEQLKECRKELYQRGIVKTDAKQFKEFLDYVRTKRLDIFNTFRRLPESMAGLATLLQHFWLQGLWEFPLFLLEFKALKTLTIKELRCEIPDSFWNLPNLENLETDILNLPTTHVFPRLNHLTLCGVSSSLFAVLPEFAQLDSFTIYLKSEKGFAFSKQQSFVNQLFELLKSCKKLQCLALYDYWLNQIPDAIAELTELNTIYIVGDYITDFKFSRKIAQMPKLERFCLSGFENLPTQLPDFKQITTLEIENFRDEPSSMLTVLRQMPQLKNLKLIHTKDALPDLEKYKDIEFLESLKMILPNTKITANGKLVK